MSKKLLSRITWLALAALLTLPSCGLLEEESPPNDAPESQATSTPAEGGNNEAKPTQDDAPAKPEAAPREEDEPSRLDPIKQREEELKKREEELRKREEALKRPADPTPPPDELNALRRDLGTAPTKPLPEDPKALERKDGSDANGSLETIERTQKP